VIELRIAYVRSSLLSGSGIVNHIMEIAKRIVNSGNEAAIISREKTIKASQIPICELRFVGDSIPFLRNLVFPARTLRTLKDFDLVHTQYHPDIFVGNSAATFLEKPHVFTYHGFAPVRTWRNYRQRLKMIDHRMGTFFALRSRVDEIITVSHYLKEELVKRYFVKKEKIHVVYNGVDTERFNPEVDGSDTRKFYKLGKRPVVLYLGRLAPYKGVQFMIQAIPKVLKAVPETKFLIGGAMRYETADLNYMIKRLEIQDSVVFTGYVSNQNVPKLYACCDVFCYPSLWEGFGLTPAEAQACGKPVVAFSTCALPEVVKNKRTGLLVEPKDIEDLADALVTLLQDKERRFRMAFEARKRVVRLFSWDKAAEQTIQVYQEALS
jgi:glycosyltransferase involved in cell wall biosynthesis